MTKWPTIRDIARDVLLILGGLAGIYHETVIAPTPRESLLLLFGAMIGLPLFLHSDGRKS
jgi:hypothetical protein